jgi:hypothetical protein
MGKDDLAFKMLSGGLDALRMVHGERANMGRLARQVFGFHPAERHGRADDGLLVRRWDVRTGEHDAGKYHPGIGRVRANLGDLSPRDCTFDPRGCNHGDHHCLGLRVLVEVNRVRDDVRDPGDADLALAVGFEDFGPMLLHDLGKLPELLALCDGVGT